MGGVTVQEIVSLGCKTVEHYYSDDAIEELFPDNDGSLVNSLLRRAQRAEAEVKTLQDEVARLGRCNESISRTDAMAINSLYVHIRRLHALRVAAIKWVQALKAGDHDVENQTPEEAWSCWSHENDAICEVYAAVKRILADEDREGKQCDQDHSNGTEQ